MRCKIAMKNWHGFYVELDMRDSGHNQRQLRFRMTVVYQVNSCRARLGNKGGTIAQAL